MTIGIVFAWVLGLGVLFLDSVNAGLGGRQRRARSPRPVRLDLRPERQPTPRSPPRIGAAVVACSLAIARPLLFATLDPVVAARAACPTRALGLVFLALLGIDAAEATQAVGALLLLGLLAAPAGAAQRLTASPYLALALSAALAVAAMWLGVIVSYLDAEPASEHGGDRGGEHDLPARVRAHGAQRLHAARVRIPFQDRQ